MFHLKPILPQSLFVSTNGTTKPINSGLKLRVIPNPNLTFVTFKSLVKSNAFKLISSSPFQLTLQFIFILLFTICTSFPVGMLVSRFYSIQVYTVPIILLVSFSKTIIVGILNLGYG